MKAALTLPDGLVAMCTCHSSIIPEISKMMCQHCAFVFEFSLISFLVHSREHTWPVTLYNVFSAACDIVHNILYCRQYAILHIMHNAKYFTHGTLYRAQWTIHNILYCTQCMISCVIIFYTISCIVRCTLCSTQRFVLYDVIIQNAMQNITQQIITCIVHIIPYHSVVHAVQDIAHSLSYCIWYIIKTILDRVYYIVHSI